MSTLIIFIGLSLALVITLAVVVLIPWFSDNQPALNRTNKDEISSHGTKDNQLLSLNVAVFKDRLAELEADYAQGIIDKPTYEQQKVLLERQLLAISEDQNTSDQHTFIPNTKSRLIFLVWIPCLAAMAYLIIGDRTPVYQLWQAQNTVGQVADDLLTGKIDTPPASAAKDPVALVSAMQTNVHHHATDAMRWFRLGEVFNTLQAPEQALEAFARAYRLSPDDEQIAISYAQTSFFGQGGQLDSQSRQVLNHLLTLNPKHQGAQMLMAMGDMRDGRYPEARQWVTQLKNDIAARSGDHSQALQSLNDLEKTIDERQQQAAQAIDIHVTTVPEILGQVQKGDSLFVTVRPLAGGAPVAAKKISADNLGKDGMHVAISDNDSIMPTAKLSSALQGNHDLVVSARISRSGDAMPKSGDLTSNPVPLDHTAKSLTVLIDKRVP